MKMKLRIEIVLDNDVFQDSNKEVCNILDALSQRFADSDTLSMTRPHRLLPCGDIDGNITATIELRKE